MSQNYSNIVEPDCDGSYKKLYEIYRDKYRGAASEAKEAENAIADFCTDHATITTNGTYNITYDESFKVDVNATYNYIPTTIIHSADSGIDWAGVAAVCADTYSGKQYVIVAGGGVSKGGQYTYNVYKDHNGNVSALTIYSNTAGAVLTISGIDSSMITYSDDHAMAIIQLASSGSSYEITISGQIANTGTEQ